MGVSGEYGALTANGFSRKEKLSEEMWNAVQSLLLCDVIQEKESMHFNKACVFLVITFLILVPSPQTNGATQVQLNILIISYLFNKDHVVNY